MTEEHWYNCSIYLEGVTGNEIVGKQDMINAGDNMFTTGSQVFPLNRNNDKGESLFDVFIYYKSKFIGEVLVKEEHKVNGKITIPGL